MRFRRTLTWSFLLILNALVASASASEAFVEGVHYDVIEVPVKTGLEAEQPRQVEVTEVFSYLCGHCYSFDPFLHQWEQTKAEQAVFTRVPAVFSPDWALMAQAFYTADILGVAEQMHPALFEAIHVQPRNLRDEDQMAALFSEYAEVSKDEFKRAFDSFFVRSRVMQADAKSRAFGVTGVPTMIVNGKYRVDGRMAGSNQGMLEVVDFLVQRELADN